MKKAAKKKPGRKPGFKHSEKTRARMSAAHLLNRSKVHDDDPEPPTKPVPRGTLEMQLDYVGALATEMCGGLGIANIEEWQTWVFRVITATKLRLS